MKTGSLGIPVRNAEALSTLSQQSIDRSQRLVARLLKSPYFRSEPFLKNCALRFFPAPLLRQYLYHNGLVKWAFKNEAREKCCQLLERHLNLASEDPANQETVRRLFCHLEQWSPPAGSPYWRKDLRIDDCLGREFLDAALHRGQGLIVVCAHVGPFKYLPWFFQKMGLKADLYFPLGWPMREDKSPATGTRFLLKAVRALKQNGIVALMGDLSWGRAATFPFLETELDFPVGFARVAQRTGATILPTFCLTDRGNRNLVKLAPPLWRDQYPGTEEEQVLAMTTTFISHLEQVIKEYPDNADKYFLGSRLILPPPKGPRGVPRYQTIESSIFAPTLLAEGF
jgi:hypothetical protein